jgi:hypothetical protein
MEQSMIQTKKLLKKTRGRAMSALPPEADIENGGQAGGQATVPATWRTAERQK